MGGAPSTYQMPVDPSTAMASNNQSQDALKALNLGGPAENFDATKAIAPINTHPEAVTNAIIKAIGTLATSAAGAYGSAAGGASEGSGALDAFMKSKSASDLPTQAQADSVAGGSPAMSSWRTIG